MVLLLYRYFLRQVADPDQVDASRTEAQLACAGLQRRLRDHLAQNRIDADGDALGRHDGDGAIAAIDFDAVTLAGIIPRFALDIFIGFTPLNLSQSRVFQPQRQYKCQYDQQSFHRL